MPLSNNVIFHLYKSFFFQRASISLRGHFHSVDSKKVEKKKKKRKKRKRNESCVSLTLFLIHLKAIF